MTATETLARADDGGGGEAVVTEALRALRRSALCCRRARLMFESTHSPCKDAACSASLTHGRELLDRPT
jgi:hypothetical protein